MVKFQMHAASNVLEFEHGTAPGGTGNGDLHRTGTEFGMSREESFTAAEKNGRIAVMQSLNFKDGRGWEIVQKNSSFDFGLHDSAVDLVGQVRMRSEHTHKTFYGVYSKSGRAGAGIGEPWNMGFRIG